MILKGEATAVVNEIDDFMSLRFSSRTLHTTKFEMHEQALLKTGMQRYFLVDRFKPKEMKGMLDLMLQLTNIS